MFLKGCTIVGIFLIICNIILCYLFGVSINGLLGFIVGFGLLFLGLFYTKMPHRLRVFLNISIALGMILVSIILGLIFHAGYKNTAKFDEEVMIVLGSGIRGIYLTPMLKERLNAALEYFEKNPDVKIIVCGGQGYGEDIPEALAMQRYLVYMGVTPDKIIMEDKSINTYENLENARHILGSGDYKIVIVTTDFHMYRALKIAKKNGFIALSYNAPLDFILRFGSTLREILSVLKLWITY